MRRASMHSLLFSAPESLHGSRIFRNCDAKLLHTSMLYKKGENKNFLRRNGEQKEKGGERFRENGERFWRKRRKVMLHLES